MSAAVVAAAPAASTQALWYVTRASGAVALVLLTLSLLLGILDSQRFSAGRHWPRFVIDGFHRNASLLVLVFLAVHILTAAIDTFAPVSLLDSVIPFGSSYRPLWLGLGALAFDLMLAIVVTSLLRQRVGFAAWRWIHWLAYACWPLAVVHSFGTGSDAKLAWMLILAAGCVGLVVAAVVWRAASGWPDHRLPRTLALGAALAGPLALTAWLVSGPLAAGWARRSGTPRALLAGASRPAARRAGGQNASAGLSAPFTARLSGTATQSAGDGGLSIIRIAATLSAGASGQLQIVLTGTPISSGGLAMTGSRVTLGPTSAPEQYSGQISDLTATRMTGRVSSADGHAISLRVDLQLDQSTGSVSGTLHATPG